MKILVIADEESRSLWDFFSKDKVEGIDLILSAGDLDADYLSFLTTLVNVPVLYIRGNHDDKYEQKPPEGCICIEDMVYNFEGVRILGLGGSMRYRPGENQYSESEMRRRILKMKLRFKLFHGFDILLTHAPAFQLNDGRDLPHQGFKVFLELMDKYKPRYFVHGHMHLNYGPSQKRLDRYGETTVVNAYEKYIIEI